jgi:hypothetical protein
LFLFARIFLGCLPIIVATVRHHHRRWWIYFLAVLGTGAGNFGWPSYLVGWIYFTLLGLPFELNVAGWTLLAWSVIIWIIAMVWATRRIDPAQVYRTPG